MRILHTVQFYYPSVGGAQEVVKQISERLVRRGHEVTVATTRLPGRPAEINGVRIVEFDVSGNAVRGLRGEVERYQRFLLSSSFDVMMNYAAQQWATDAVFPLLDRLPYAKVLTPCGFSALHRPEYAAYFAAMPDVLRRYDHLIFHSATYQDVEFARKHGLTHYTVIPNGAAEDEFAHDEGGFRRRHGIPEDVPLLLTVSSHTGLKGHRLILSAFQRARIGRAVLIINGNVVAAGRGCLPHCRRRALWIRLSSLGRKRVLLFDLPRRDVVAAFHAADLFLLGSHIEYSPLVLFEAMASGTPFITPACGNAEEIVAWGQGGIVLPTTRRPDGWVDVRPREMARAIERLLADPQERGRLGEAGRRAWRERFTWEKIALEYERLYESLLQGR